MIIILVEFIMKNIGKNWDKHNTLGIYHFCGKELGINDSEPNVINHPQNHYGWNKPSKNGSVQL